MPSSSTDREKFRYLGRGTPLRDAVEKVTGRLRYTADLPLPGILHIRPVLSPYAHARIVSIDREQARMVTGVVAVLVAEDLPSRDQAINSRSSAILARDRVLFNGQPVVAVVGETPSAAQDGAEKVQVEYEPLEPVVDPEKALLESSMEIWPDGIPESEVDIAADHGAERNSRKEASANPPNVNRRHLYQRGNLEQGFRAADAVVDKTYRTEYVHQAYMEPQACAVMPEPDGGLTVFTGTQAPRGVRNEVARLMSLPQQKVNVAPMPVGGGFGGKHGLMEPLAAAVAITLNRPVRLELTRTEDFLSAMPSSGCVVNLKTAADKDGAFLALEALILMDNGVFATPWGNLLATILGSTYNVPNVSVECLEVNTNKPMGGPYRAPSAPLSAFVLESNVDLMVRELGLDPLEFRNRNACSGEEPMINGKPWPSLGIRECLTRLREQPLVQNAETGENEGIGIALGIWPCNAAPAGANCRVTQDGTVQVFLGSADISGINTGFAQVAAEVLDVPLDAVEVIQQDTRNGPIAPVSGGSMVSYSVIHAIRSAVEEVREQLLTLAADHFEADARDLELNQGQVHVKGLPGRTVTLAALAEKAESSRGASGPVMGSGRSAVPENAPAASVHWVKVRVDPETGVVTPLKYLVVQDVGFALNPTLVKGQIQGGVAQGLGWGLREAMVFDQQGLLLNPGFLDYSIFRADEVPPLEIEMVEYPSPHGPYGIRGVGEPPIVPGAAAIANAVEDAVGVRITELPIRPESVWRAMQDFS